MLKQLSGRSLCAKVATESVARLFLLADRHSASELKRTCIKHIRDHAALVMATEDWKLVDIKLVVEAFRQLVLEYQK